MPDKKSSLGFLLASFTMLAGVLLIVYIIAGWLQSSYSVPIAISAFVVLGMGMFFTSLVSRNKV